MKVMVIGATGFIGPPLARRLVETGHEVVAVSRGATASSPGVEALAIDRGEPNAVAGAAEARRVEAVVDLLGMTLAATAPLVDALAGRVGRYVLASSGDVYRRYGAIRRREADPNPQRRLSEDAPLRTRLHPYRTDPPRSAEAADAWMDDYDKIPIERMLAGRVDIASAVLRLPMVFGPGDRYGRFTWAIAPMLANAATVDMDVAWSAWRCSYGYVDDVAAGLALAAVHPRASGVYNLGPDEAPDHAHWGERFAATMGWTGEFRRLDRSQVPSGARARLDALDLSLPMVIDTRKVRAELGYREVVDPADALERTVAAEIARLAD